MKLARTILWLCLLFLLPLPGLAQTGSEGLTGNKGFSAFLSEDNLLTVSVKNIPLEKVLTEIAKQTSIKISLYAPAQEPVWAEFSELSLEKGLKRLTKGFNSVFIYDLEGSEKGESQIKEVIIYAKTGASTGKGPRTLTSRQVVGPQSGDSRESDLSTRPETLVDEDKILQPTRVAGQAEAGGDDPVVDLGRVLTRDQDGDVKVDAAGRLGDLGDERALVPLVGALGDNDPEVRKRAADALCQIGGENVIRALEGCLSDGNEDLREIAAETLKRLQQE
jgi:hypothetical protein